MAWLRRLFDFKGCAGRGEYWAFALGCTVVNLLLAVVARVAGEPLLGLLIVPVIAVQLAVTVRRLHDRGKVGWWALLFYGVPFGFNYFRRELQASDSTIVVLLVVLPVLAICLWAFIELGILPGKRTSNRYVTISTQVAEAFD